MSTFLTVLFFATTMLALFARQIAADRAANLETLNLELRYALDDATRECDRLHTSNSHHVRESVALVAEVDRLTSRNAYLEAKWQARKDHCAAVVLTHGFARPERKMEVYEWGKLP